MEAWKGESYDLLSFMYHVCGNKIIVIVKKNIVIDKISTGGRWHWYAEGFNVCGA